MDSDTRAENKPALVSPKKQTAFQKWKAGDSEWFIVRWFIGLGIVLLFLPYILTQNSLLSFNVDELGQVGDIIGGTTAPFIGFSAVIVTFYAFWVQYQSNIHQRTDIRLERFENQFYEMLRLHSANIQEMNIADKFLGRKCFVPMFNEFKFIYLSAFEIAHVHKKILKKNYQKSELCDISYKLFFNGIGSLTDNQAERHFKKADHALVNLIREKLSKVQNQWVEASNESKVIVKSPKRNLDTFLEMLKVETSNLTKSSIVAVSTEDNETAMAYEMFYFPFDGHIHRLGHYYRHLFQTVSFVVDSTTVTDRLDKYKYLKLLRAQLSNHEQLLLYYNGLTTFGKVWFDKGYFTDFRMVKNISLIMSDFGVKPKESLPKENRFGEKLFEWDV